MYSVQFFHSLCAHPGDTSTHVDCSSLFETDHTESSHTCPLTRHITCIALNASRNWDASGAWSQTMASGKVPCLAHPCVGVWVDSNHGSLQDQLMEAESTQRLFNTNSTARPVARMVVFMEPRRVRQTRWTFPQRQVTNWSMDSCTTCWKSS